MWIFRSGGSVCLWNGQSAVRLADSSGVSYAAISDDGAVIAFPRQVDDLRAELWAVNADGAGERRLVSADDFAAMNPIADGVLPNQFRWQPNSHQLFFNTRQAGYGLTLHDDLRITDADTLEQNTILEIGSGGQFKFSPDGSQIALVTPTTISIVNENGGDRRDALAFAEVSTQSEYRFYPDPVWDADSQSLRAATSSPDPSAPDAALNVWYIPSDGSPASLLSTFATGPRHPESPVAFSPDLSRSAIFAGPALRLAKVDGSEDVIYHTGNMDSYFVWRSDSEFAFVLDGVLQWGQVGGPFAPAPPPQPVNVPLAEGC